MSVHSIPLGALKDGRPVSGEQARNWCASLESGDILYFPETPVPIPGEDLQFLLSHMQLGSRLHKNIAYKPSHDALSGIAAGKGAPGDVERLNAVMRRYSASVAAFLAAFLAPYKRRWRLDYASFRPVEEKDRALPLRQRNDLLHTDAFPTRPSHGWRILRFFHNIHPARTRDWIVGEPFKQIVRAFVPDTLSLPKRDSTAMRATRRVVRLTGLAKLVPRWQRTPYDEFMVRLHNAMKEDAAFQNGSMRQRLSFAPGSSWMVYTETVPHAVVAGQYALEQTLLVDPEAMVLPDSPPIAILEKMRDCL